MNIYNANLRPPFIKMAIRRPQPIKGPCFACENSLFDLWNENNGDQNATHRPLKRDALEAWHREGISCREIARRLGISDATVRRNLQKLADHGSMKSRPKCGRSRSTSERDDRLLVRTSRRNRFLTAPELTVDLAATYGVSVHRSTVSRHLAKVGLNGRVAKHKPRPTASRLDGQ